MKKRIICFMLCLIICFGNMIQLCGRAKAVPAPGMIGAGVLYSFLWSSGIELWNSDNAAGQSPKDSLETAMRNLWNDYGTETEASVPAFDNLANDISFDSFGRAIIAHTLALQFNDFAKWVASKFGFQPNQQVPVGGSTGEPGYYYVDSSVAENMPGLQAGYWALPAAAQSGEFNFIYNTSDTRYSMVSTNAEFIYGSKVGSGNPTYFYISKNPFYYRWTVYQKNSSGEFEQIAQNEVNGAKATVTNYAGSGSLDFYSYSAIHVPENVNVNTINATSQQANNVRPEIVYTILFGSEAQGQVGGIANIGNTIIDNVYDLLEDQALAIDVGLTGAEEDKAEAFVTEAAGAYSAGEEAALGFGSVATPVPIEGVQELYPSVDDIVTDVEGMDTSGLGYALSTRFPFCIPYDINYLFKSLSASPQRPVFTVDVIPTSLKTKIGITQSTSFTVDFGDQKYSLLLKIIRWSCLFGFILCLAFVTKRLIWTTGG